MDLQVGAAVAAVAAARGERGGKAPAFRQLCGGRRVFTRQVQGVEAAGSLGRVGGKHENPARPAPGQCPLQAA